MTRDELALHLRYSAWAAARLLHAAATLPPGEAEKDRGVSHGSIEGTLAHAFLADRVWLRRLTGVSSPFLAPDEPAPTVGSLARDWPVLHDGWRAWAESVADSGALCTYYDLKGNPHRTPYGRIVLHVVNHASIHAGQVTAMLRQIGVVPPQTDLITFYREISS